eukprot:CAMPEP_0194314768 /NCGR_PEP_ID=MMETSP0171-20130528/11602_1 /TAXON_ID=218684 /ORGANISM="Corethron pennatum, Strain L29A3" /LENGTH=1168 /DNA_ID=CAMNT_0039070325 /DNA_START=704 /DNA_END=4207 /DNA_ORIENTATION=+
MSSDMEISRSSDMDISSGERSETDFEQCPYNLPQSSPKLKNATNNGRNGSASLNKLDLDVVVHEFNVLSSKKDVINHHLQKSEYSFFIKHLSKKLRISEDEIDGVAGHIISKKMRERSLDNKARRKSSLARPSPTSYEEYTGNNRLTQSGHKENLTRSATAMGARPKGIKTQVSRATTSTIVTSPKPAARDIEEINMRKDFSYPELNKGNLIHQIDNIYRSDSKIVNLFADKLALIFGVSKNDMKKWERAIGTRLLSLKTPQNTQNKSDLEYASPTISIRNEDGNTNAVDNLVIRNTETPIRNENCFSNDTNPPKKAKLLCQKYDKIMIKPNGMAPKKINATKKESEEIPPPISIRNENNSDVTIEAAEVSSNGVAPKKINGAKKESEEKSPCISIRNEDMNDITDTTIKTTKVSSNGVTPKKINATKKEPEEKSPLISIRNKNNSDVTNTTIEVTKVSYSEIQAPADNSPGSETEKNKTGNNDEDLSTKRKFQNGVPANFLPKKKKSQISTFSPTTLPRPNARDIDSGQAPPLYDRDRSSTPARSCYRIGIAGGGLAGISCARRLLQEAKKKKINVEVLLFEGRDRVGGRVCTEMGKFKHMGELFPVDLGASFIHGIDDNPISKEAKKAGSKIVVAPENVKMIGEDKVEISEKQSDKIRVIYGKLVAESLKLVRSKKDNNHRCQPGSYNLIRWYASPFCEAEYATKKKIRYRRTDVDSKRYKEYDCTANYALGKAVRDGKAVKYNKLTQEDKRLIGWSIQNDEYSDNACLTTQSALHSMTEDNNDYSGRHAYIQQGYSRVVDNIFRNCQEHSQFEIFFNCQIKRIEYARDGPPTRNKKGTKSKGKIFFSDTCRVISADNVKHDLDFVVCALPLGVLKESEWRKESGGIKFEPALSKLKIEAINALGFGCLNKIVLQFQNAFWRKTFLGSDTYSFGNVTGLHPQYYFFYDIGYLLAEDKNNAPAILVTMVSGKDAVKIEACKDRKVILEVCEVLTFLFTEESVPKKPIRYKITRWGSDRFSRGSYSFLPPGSSPHDYGILSEPSNGNGDSHNLEHKETMRLFWAGEHTNEAHPATAHGAMESGVRAAEEVLGAIEGKKSVGRSNPDIEVSIQELQSKQPNVPITCDLCSEATMEEDPIVVFKKGSKFFCAHYNCVSWSPEVQVEGGVW